MPSFDEHYFDNHTEVRIHCEGTGCWVEVESQCRKPSRSVPFELQFLLQPRAENQLPVGPPLLVHQERFELRCDPRTGRGTCWGWLPAKLKPELLERCHLRLVSTKLNLPSELNRPK